MILFVLISSNPFFFGLISDTCKQTSKCLSLKNCKPFIKLLDGLKKPLKPSIIAFLRAQQCGFENGFPKVCCRTMPKELRVMNYTTTTTTITKIIPTNPTTITTKASTKKEMIETIETTTKAIEVNENKRNETNKKVLAKELNRILMDDLFDTFSPYDLFRRRRDRSKKYNVDVEIR